VSGASGSPSPTRRDAGRSPAGVVRTAVIGFGTAGRVFHAPFVEASPRFSLDFVVTGNPERQQAVGDLYPQATVCESPEALFERSEELDLVVIGSPPDTHVPLAREAIRRGIAVVVDKPFSVTADEGRQLIAEAERAGVPLTVFQNRRWDGDFLTLQSLLDSGSLGHVRRFESRFEWWKPEESKAWKRESLPGQGGGILFDLGTHLIDQALRLFGPVRSSYAELASHRTPGTDDDSFVSLLHESGVRSQLWMNGMAAQVGPRFHVLGSSSAYTKWGLDSQEATLKAGVKPSEQGYGVEPESSWGLLGVDGSLERVPAERGQYDAFYAGLAAALLDGGPLPVDPADAVAVIELIEDLHERFGVVDEG
jgi:scyllo-inositol 2-dehydrogenase (NADP+)